MRIAIMGSGGVGGYFGGRLALAGQAVTFIARGKHLEAIRSHGLSVKSIKGDFTLPAPMAVDNPSRVGTVDLVLVCVKTWQLEQAARDMAPLLAAETVVLPLLNGVEAVAQLENLLPQGIVLGGIARIVSYIAGPGHIRHTAIEPYIGLGSMDGRHTDRIQQIHQSLLQAGIQSEIPHDVPSALWSKFLFVCAWGGVGALARAPVGVIRALPQSRALLSGAMTEIQTVARARGIELADDIVERAMRFVDGMNPENTSSLQRDIVQGRPSELEAWSGAVVRIGRQHGVRTPVHDVIYAALLPQETAARGMSRGS
jgi:2-dehydropantoate 2-reductase